MKFDFTNHSYWRSVYTGQIYEMPLDWIPSFGGWEHIVEG